MFDKLIILNKGEMNYFGKAKDSIRYYKSAGYDVEEHRNPIDKYIDIAIKCSPETRK